MSLFDLIFPKQKIKKELYSGFKIINGYTPAFTNWNGSIYESELVRASVDSIARNVGKLKVEIQGTARPDVQTILSKHPNEWMTWYQFLYRLATIWAVDNTAFIVPVYDRFGDLKGIFPVLPNSCEVVEYKGEIWLKYHFRGGDKAALPMAECGILTRFQYDKEFFGADSSALDPTMKLIHLQNQGIKEAIRSGASFRFSAQPDNFIAPDDLKKERLRFNEISLKDEGGVLLFPYNYKNIQQINSKPYTVDADQMKLIQDNVYNYFGVNEDVIQSKAFGDKWSAFYEGVIEAFAIQLSQTLTKMLFTERQQAQGTFVMVTANRLQYMSNAEKLSVSSQMLDRGIMSRNEVREIWNLPPLENGDDYIIRGEYYNADAKLDEQEGNEDV